MAVPSPPVLAPPRAHPNEHTAARGPLERGRIVVLAAVIGLVEAAGAALAAPDDAWRAVVRVTAQTSAVWFALAFAATPLVALRPAPATKWLLRNRRYLGLAMALSQGVHLVAIFALATRLGAAFWASIAPSTLFGGALGYVFLAAMTVTSTDRAAARLGRRRWRLLHATGMWFFWAIFASTYAGMLGKSPLAIAVTLAMLALVGLRLAAFVRKRRKTASRR